MSLSRKRASLLLTVLIACIGLSGCMAGSAVLAMTKSTDQFLTNTTDPRVMYEPGAADLAQHVAKALPAALQTVQQAQYRNFVAPVKIYVCASIESFKAYGAPSGREGGFVLNKRLFISPKPENTAERITRVLTHELSHLQIEQQTGLLKSARIPSWFKEGLAVYVAKGGGAETVTEDQARNAIQQNKYFQPETEGSLLFPKRARDYGLEPHIFYREASMFVAYLNHLDDAKFKSFLLAIQDGLPFSTAFEDAYGVDIGDVWSDFLAEMKKPNTAFERDAPKTARPSTLR
ncbi:MAG: hypothetical protein HZB62_06610 [Nitrospirae bacterium]|nr:hypothetical protein [Nitrospirota bacterium]